MMQFDPIILEMPGGIRIKLFTWIFLIPLAIPNFVISFIDRLDFFLYHSALYKGP
jgi:hypothetical protein